MKTTYLLLSGPMPSALIENRKTQTRRVVKLPAWASEGKLEADPMNADRCIAVANETGCFADVVCPYGKPGDQLVFLSTWAAPKEFDAIKPLDLPKDVRVWSVFDGTPKPDWCGKSRPGRFMPGWMRYRMPKAELIAVRVERLQDISESDARAEGIGEFGEWEGNTDVGTPQKGYKELWESINGSGSFDLNPYVWVLTFKRI